MLLWKILLNRWTVLIIGAAFMCIGLMPELTMKAVRIAGKMGWAEKSVGSGGTFTVWKIIGVIAPILSILYFFSWYKNVTFFNETQTQQNVPVQSGTAGYDSSFGY